jgi:hypothetical protein
MLYVIFKFLPVVGIIFTGVWVDNAAYTYRGADKFLARPGRKQATATEDFEFHISYL